MQFIWHENDLAKLEYPLLLKEFWCGIENHWSQKLMNWSGWMGEV